MSSSPDSVQEVRSSVSQPDRLMKILTALTAMGPILAAILRWFSPDFSAGEQGQRYLVAILLLTLGSFGILVWKQLKASKELRETLRAEQDNAAGLKRRLDDAKNNMIRMIHPEEYLRILRNIATKRGPGHLLLFNIELNTFGDDKMFNALWSPVADMPEILSVRLALPPGKFERWERIVTGVRQRFFAEHNSVAGVPNGTRFIACRYQEKDSSSNDRSGHRGTEAGPRAICEDRIAFALYESSEHPGMHDWGVVFLINRPFVEERPDGILDYLHILEYNGNHEVLNRCRGLWNVVFNPNRAETAIDIQEYTRHINGPMDLDKLLSMHGCDDDRSAIMKRVVGAGRLVCKSKPAPDSLCRQTRQNDGRIEFEIVLRYKPPFADKTEPISAYGLGLPSVQTDHSLQCLIWSPGFGDEKAPKMARIVSRELGDCKPRPAELFFKPSGIIEETTCTRLSEDIEAIVEYAAQLPSIDASRIHVIAMSLSGYLAAQIARRDRRIRSLLLIAPPFDVIEMLDNLREHHYGMQHADGRAPMFGDFLRARPNLRIADWDENDQYCNYFNHVVRCCHLVDIAVSGPPSFRSEPFLDAIGEVTQSGRHVHLLYGKDDPIVRPDKYMPQVDRAIESGKIVDEYFHAQLIPAAHFYPNPGDLGAFPWRFDDAKKTVEEISRAIRKCMEAAEPGDDDEGPCLSLKKVG